MAAITPDDLVDHIYEAAVLPDLWPGVLDGVAALGRTLNGVLFAVPPDERPPGATSVRWISSESAAETTARWMQEGWTQRNLLIERTLKLDRAGFVRDQDLCTPEEIAREPIYESFRRIGYGWNTGFLIQVPSGDLLTFNWNRAWADGPISPETLSLLDPLRPHLARAALVSSRLALERARAASATLAMLGLPAAILSERHRIVATNALLERLMPRVVEEGAAGRLRLRNRRANELFSQALSNAQALPAGVPRSQETVFSVPLPSEDEDPPMVLHVLPVRRTARDVFSAGASIVIVTPVRPGTMPAASVIRGLFDLTATEARIARLIGGGHSVREIAADSNTSEGTVRTQLKAVFAKTGVTRQSELVGLLGNVDPVRQWPD